MVPAMGGGTEPLAIKDLERRAYRLAIVEYLTFCKRARQRATVASARLFMAEVEARRRLSRVATGGLEGGVELVFQDGPSASANPVAVSCQPA